MKRSTTLLLVIFIALLIVPGCEPKQKPITKDEALVFASEIEKSMANDDLRFFNEAIDVKTFADRMKIGKVVKRSDLEGMIRKSFKLGNEITTVIGSSGSYKLVRDYEKDGKQHLLFRLYYDGNVNYHDAELIRIKGKCKIADIYVYLSGENITETMGELIKTGYKEASEYDSPSDPRAKWLKSISEIRGKIKSGDYAGAKKLIDEIPENVRKEKAVQLLNIQAVTGLDGAQLVEAIEEYKKLYPGEPNIPFLMINAYAVQGNFKKVREAVDQLDKQVGGDPFLDFYRGNSYMLDGDEVNGREHLERLLKKMPDFTDAALELVASYLRAEEYDKARPYIDKLKANPDFDKKKLTYLLYQYPGYGEKFGEVSE